MLKVNKQGKKLSTHCSTHYVFIWKCSNFRNYPFCLTKFALLLPPKAADQKTRAISITAASSSTAATSAVMIGLVLLDKGTEEWEAIRYSCTGWTGSSHLLWLCQWWKKLNKWKEKVILEHNQIDLIKSQVPTVKKLE